jgi:anthranilate phosphoribosyltransferase
MADLKPLIAKVAAGTPLSRAEAREAFNVMMSGDATPSQIGGFLMALRVRGETVDEITGAVEIMREKMLRVAAPAVPSTSSARAGMHLVPTIFPPVPPSWRRVRGSRWRSTATGRCLRSRARRMC